VALLLPAVQAAREAARRAQCSNNLKQIGIALLNYADSKKELPYGSAYLRPAPNRKGNWVIETLPFFEQGALQGQYDTDKFPDETPNVQLAASTTVPLLICPSDPVAQSPILPDRRAGAGGGRNPITCQGLWYTGSMGPTIPDICAFDAPKPSGDDTYKYTCLGCGYGTINPPGMNGKQYDHPRPPCSRFHHADDVDNCAGLFCRRHLGTQLKTVTDGLSNTIMAGETLPGEWIWNCIFCDNFPVSSTHIVINNFIPMETQLIAPDRPDLGHHLKAGYKSAHAGGGINVVFGDGGVHWLSDSIDYVTYNMLGSRASGDVPPGNAY
jgi:hypothetical protein